MEKQHEAAPDSISSVGVPIKEYPPSEVYSSEPPPAYVRPRHTAVQIARIAAVTLIAVSFILGFFMVASAYITATATCYQDYPVPQENGEDRPTYQHLVVDPLDSEESAAHHRQESLGLPQTVSPPQDQQPSEQQSQEQPIQIKLPLQLDFDELAGSLIEKNQRSRMNCVVEKRRAEEVTDHQPRTVRLPFGVNISSDPRYEHITGERMAIFCESGNDQRHVPMEQQMTPIVVPIPVHHMPMPHHNGGMPQPIQIHPNALPHPGVQRGDALPPQVRMHLEALHQQQLAQQHQQQLAQQHQQHMQQQMQLQQQGPPQIQIHPSGLPPHVIPQVPPQFHPHVFHSRPAQPQPQPQYQQQSMGELDEAALQQVGVALQQVGAGPDEEHQLIIQEEEMMPEGLMGRGGPEVMMGRGMTSQEQQGGPEVPADTVRPPPVPFQRLPVHHQQQPSQIMLHHQQPPQPLQVQEAPQPRPHFVQPRSVRSVDSVLLNREKRVRRCACDCAC